MLKVKGLLNTDLSTEHRCLLRRQDNREFDLRLKQT